MKRFTYVLAGSLVVVGLASTQVINGQVRGSKGMHLRELPKNVIDPPRTPDGKPDLHGTWNAVGRQGVPAHSIEEGSDPYSQTLQGGSTEYIAGSFGTVIVDPKDGWMPYQPWAKAKRFQLLQGLDMPLERWQTDPEDRCLPPGIPRTNFFAVQILQRPGYVLFLADDYYRVVPTDGRPHLSKDVQLYMGDSRGHWEGSTLVIDVTNHSEVVWLDSHASFHSKDMRVTERWTLVDKDTLFYEATIDDPKVFTQPWKVALTYDRNPVQEREVWEEACFEGERSVHAMVAAGRKRKAAGEKPGIHEHDIKECARWIAEAKKKGAKQGQQADAIQACRNIKYE